MVKKDSTLKGDYLSPSFQCVKYVSHKVLCESNYGQMGLAGAIKREQIYDYSEDEDLL